jgi:hypothetical protein
MGLIFGAMDRTLTLRLDGELADNLLAISGTGLIRPLEFESRPLISRHRGPLARQKKPNRPDDKEQSKLFIEKAREIGADEEKSGG